MRVAQWVLLFSTALSNLNAAHAEICGLFHFDDFGGPRSSQYTLTHISPFNQSRYSISNPESPLVKKMLVGSCYCVNGDVDFDSRFRDRAYFVLRIDQIVVGPYSGCTPK